MFIVYFCFLKCLNSHRNSYRNSIRPALYFIRTFWLFPVYLHFLFLVIADVFCVFLILYIFNVVLMLINSIVIIAPSSLVVCAFRHKFYSEFFVVNPLILYIYIFWFIICLIIIFIYFIFIVPFSEGYFLVHSYSASVYYLPGISLHYKLKYSYIYL